MWLVPNRYVMRNQQLIYIKKKKKTQNQVNVCWSWKLSWQGEKVQWDRGAWRTHATLSAIKMRGYRSVSPPKNQLICQLVFSKNIYWLLARCSKQATKYFTLKQTALLQSTVPSYEHKHEFVALFNFRHFYLKSSFPLSFVTRPSSCNSSWPSVLPMWKCLNIYLYSEVPNAAVSILIVRSLL